MMQLVRRWLIAGASGSREYGLFMALALAVGPFTALTVLEALGIPMPQAWGALMVMAPLGVAAGSAAFIGKQAQTAGWVKPRSMKAADIVAEMDK